MKTTKHTKEKRLLSKERPRVKKLARVRIMIIVVVMRHAHPCRTLHRCIVLAKNSCLLILLIWRSFALFGKVK